MRSVHGAHAYATCATSSHIATRCLISLPPHHSRNDIHTEWACWFSRPAIIYIRISSFVFFFLFRFFLKVIYFFLAAHQVIFFLFLCLWNFPSGVIAHLRFFFNLLFPLFPGYGCPARNASTSSPFNNLRTAHHNNKQVIKKIS